MPGLLRGGLKGSGAVGAHTRPAPADQHKVSDPAGPATTNGGWWQASDGRWYPASEAPARSEPTSSPSFPPPSFPPPTFQPMAPPSAWRGLPVPHRPPDPLRPSNRSVVAMVLGVFAVVVLVIGALVAFSSASDDRPDDLASGPASTAPVTEAPAPPTSQVMTEDLLGTMNVQKNDIGSNWTQMAVGTVPPGTDDCQFPVRGVRASHEASYVLHLNGVSNMVQGQLTSITTVFVDDQAAVRQEGVDGSDTQGECLRGDSEALWEVAGSGMSPSGTIARQETAVTRPSLGWRYQTTFMAQTGDEVVAYTDYVIVRRGRVRVAMSMLSIEEPFDPVLEELLISRVAERIAETIKAED